MRGHLMRLWTPEQHKALLLSYQSNDKAVVSYNNSPQALATKTTVTRQNVQYWRRIFADGEKPNMARADRELKEERRLRTPEADDDIGVLPDLRKQYRSILHIPDQHMPYHHPDMFDFLFAVKKAFNPELVVNAGDEVDHHALSFHDSDPNLNSAGKELAAALPHIQRLRDMFPVMLICSSNHGSLAFRKAKAHGIPVEYIKSYREVLFPQHGAPGWSWAYSWVVQTPAGEVMFKHQSSNPVAEAAHERCNLLVGHAHGKFHIDYAQSTGFQYWGGTGGCLIDADGLAFKYGKHHTNKPIIGVTVILDGHPMLIPMQMSKEGRWTGQL